MYYPLQIPNLLNKEFKSKVEYNEYHRKELEKFNMCIWTMKSKETIEKVIYNTILPDACIDLIFDLNQNQIFFSAFSKATEFFELEGDINFIGIRFKPGAFYHIYKTKSSLIMNQKVPYVKVEKQFNLEHIATETDTKKQIDLLVKYLITKTKEYQPNHFEQMINNIYSQLEEQCIEQISKDLSYSKRHVNRLFYENFGINPKTVLNILRLHKSLHVLLYENVDNLTQLAMQCGFSDQAHFIKNIKKYCGISPTELLDKYRE